MQWFKLTDSAKKQMENLLSKNPEKYAVSLAVKGGGCAGFNYQMDVTEEKKDRDHELAFGEVKVLVDERCEMFVLGTKIDYKQEIFGSYFTYDNPNAHSSCGCGTSFSVK